MSRDDFTTAPGGVPFPEGFDTSLLIDRRLSWPADLNHAELCAWRFGGRCDCKLAAAEDTQP
jgi:hypothetical protein